jgi:cyclic pyranopterin monophosphate synthase
LASIQNPFPGRKRFAFHIQEGIKFSLLIAKKIFKAQAFLGSLMEGGKMAKLTHFDKEGRARMVDVSGKLPTERVAVASGKISMKPFTLQRIMDKKIEKGDALGVARIAGIMAAKRTSDIIPMCHPLTLDTVELQLFPDVGTSSIDIKTRVKSTGKTGVEMEALVGTAAAALTIYDMCKAVDRGMIISEIMLLKKSGGKSGTYTRPKK